MVLFQLVGSESVSFVIDSLLHFSRPWIIGFGKWAWLGRRLWLRVLFRVRPHNRSRKRAKKNRTVERKKSVPARTNYGKVMTRALLDSSRPTACVYLYELLRCLGLETISFVSLFLGPPSEISSKSSECRIGQLLLDRLICSAYGSWTDVSNRFLKDSLFGRTSIQIPLAGRQ